MEEIGARLARYHPTAEQIRMPGQRPFALPLADVPGVLLSALDTADIDAHHSAVIRQHAKRLARRLPDIAPMGRERAVMRILWPAEVGPGRWRGLPCAVR